MIQLAPKSAGTIFPAPPPRVFNDASPGFPLPAFTTKNVIKPFVAPTAPTPPDPPTTPNVTVVTLEKAPKRTVDQLGKSNIEILTGFAPDVPEVLGYVDFPNVSGSGDSTTAACFSLRVQSDALNLAQAERMIQTAVENELAVKNLGYNVVDIVPEKIAKTMPFLQITDRKTAIYDRKDQIVAREIVIFEKI
jgi:hypothetical protein